MPDLGVLPNARLIPTESTLWYLRHVLRLGAGASVLVVDGAGQPWTAKLVEGAAGLEFLILEPNPSARVVISQLQIELIIALLKGDKTEIAIQKATELGVSAMRVVMCERSIPRIKPAEITKKLDRFAKVAMEATRQCGQATQPEISLDLSLEEAISKVNSALPRFVLDERGGAHSLACQLANLEKPVKGVVLAVGPEGAHSDRERLLLEKMGFQPAGLGPRVLKAETAGIVAVAISQTIIGDMGTI